MKKVLQILIVIHLIVSCSEPVKPGHNFNIETKTVSFKSEKSQDQNEIVQEKQPSKYYCDSTMIQGTKYKACSNKKNGELFVIDGKGDSILIPIVEGGPEFFDFNEDGYDDLRINYMTNVPNIFDVALYNAENKEFELINDLQTFPASTKISDTKYYYSYHRSGCADFNWDSDLFYISNLKIIKIGNIKGVGCDDEEQGVFISTIEKGSKKLINTVPIDTINSYENHKWGFIKEYWENNCDKFN